MTQNKDLTSGNPAKALLAFSLPVFAGNLFQQLYTTVDSIIVGQYVGAYALGAVGTTFPITFMVVAVATGLSNAVAILIGQNVGAGKTERVKKIAYLCVKITAVISILLTLVCSLFAKNLLHIINVHPDIFRRSYAYLQIYFVGLFFTFSYNTVSSVFRAMGDSKTPLVFLAISSVINVVLDLHFIINLDMGVAGAAWATVIAQGGSFLLQMIFMAKKLKSIPAMSRREDTEEWEKRMAVSLIKLAVPNTMQEMTIGINIFIAQALINLFGPRASGAYTACGKIENFAMMPMIAMMVATTVFVAQNTGAGLTDRAWQGFKCSVAINTAIAAVSAVLLAFFPKPLMRIFLSADSRTEVFEIGRKYLLAMAVYVFFMGVLFAAEALLKGSGDIKMMIVFALASTITKAGVSVIAMQFIGIDGIFLGAVCSWLVEMTLAMARVVSGKWKTIKKAV